MSRGEIASNLALLSPPCELTQVVRDLRALVENDSVAQRKIDESTSQYHRDQFTQICLPSSSHNSIVCNHAHLGNGKFFCPRTKTVYSFDPDSYEVIPFESASENGTIGSLNVENWRLAIEDAITNYVQEHFSAGAVSVFTSNETEMTRIIVCIESHYSKETTTGKWRSEWIIHLGDNPENCDIKITGWIRVQTHLYEEGNVQLISSKDMNFDVRATNAEVFSKECTKNINQCDDIFQVAIAENFEAMSKSTFKSLRRALPVTKTKIDWNNINAYQIGHEVSRPTAN